MCSLEMVLIYLCPAHCVVTMKYVYFFGLRKAGSCLLWVMSTEISVDIAVDIAVDTRSIVGRHSVDSRSILGRYSVDSRSI